MTTITERPQTFPPFVPQPWAVDALCAQVDSDMFYPEAGESNKVAKKLCSTCPVRVECLEYAMTTVQHFGIWGGLSAIERETRYKATELGSECETIGASETASDVSPKPPLDTPYERSTLK